VAVVQNPDTPIQTQLSAANNDNDIGLYSNLAKTVTDDRKYTLLANSNTPPPAYDIKKDTERVFSATVG